MLAERVSREASTPEARLAAAFERVVGRVPGVVERELLARMFARQRERYARDGAAAIALLSVGATPRDESFDPVEHAALTSACLAILNLDEALTRG